MFEWLILVFSIIGLWHVHVELALVIMLFFAGPLYASLSFYHVQKSKKPWLIVLDIVEAIFSLAMGLMIVFKHITIFNASLILTIVCSILFICRIIYGILTFERLPKEIERY